MIFSNSFKKYCLLYSLESNISSSKEEDIKLFLYLIS